MTKRLCVGLSLIAVLLVPATAHMQDGRWKLGGDGSCYWDPYDGGPNQCEPGAPPEVAPPDPQDEPWTELEQDLQRLGETSEELVAVGFSNPWIVNEFNTPTMIEILERHNFWDGMPSSEARDLLDDGIYARRNGMIVGYAVPRMEPAQLIDPKLKFPQANSYVPKHANPPPQLEDCWVMKQKASKLRELSRTLQEVGLLITSAGGILGGTVPLETPIKKLPMLARFAGPLIISTGVIAMGAAVSGWMASEYNFAPCQAKGLLWEERGRTHVTD